MNKKLFLICALALLCFALPRVSAQAGETEFETQVILTETETGDAETGPIVNEEDPVNAGEQDQETGETDQGETEVVVEDEEEDIQEEEVIKAEDTETGIVIVPGTGGDSGSITTATVSSGSALVGSGAVLAVSALLMF